MKVFPEVLRTIGTVIIAIVVAVVLILAYQIVPDGTSHDKGDMIQVAVRFVGLYLAVVPIGVGFLVWSGISFWSAYQESRKDRSESDQVAHFVRSGLLLLAVAIMFFIFGATVNAYYAGNS